MIGGTKCPSITSTWITRAPASQHLPDLLAQPAEVGRQDRRRDAHAAQQLACAAPYAHIGLQHRVAAVVALQDRGGGHAHDRRVLAAVGADRGQLEAVQAVDAAVAPGQVGRAQPRLAAVRALRPEVDRAPWPAASGSPSIAQLRRSRAMKKPAVRSRCGSVSTSGRAGRRPRSSPARARAARRRGRRGEVGVGIQEGGDQALVLGRGDRARRVDKHATRTEGAGAGGEDRGLRAAPSRRSPLGVTRQRRSARACSVPSPEQGGSTSTRSNTAPSGARRAPRRRPRRGRCRRAAAARCAPARRRGGGCARPRATSPAPSISAARCVLLPPGAAHRSSTRSPGLRARARARRASRRATAR